jgi:hypothetical protein
MLNLYCVNTVGSGNSSWWKFGSVYCWLLRTQTHKNCHYFHMFKSRYLASLMCIMHHFVPVDIIIISIIIIFTDSAAQRGLWPPRSRGFLITHNDATQSVGLLWASDHHVAETYSYTWQHTQKINIYTLGGIRTLDRSRQAAGHLRLRPHGHWDRHQ